MQLASKRWPAHEPSVPSSSRMLLLHGLGGGGNLWRPLAAALEEQVDLLAPDQRGHGNSRSAPLEAQDYTPLHYGQDLVDTMEAQNFYPAWVLGHSMGVRSALGLAHLRPAWVQGLILVDLGLSGGAGGGLGDPLAEFLFELPPEFPSATELQNYLTTHSPDVSIGRYLAAVAKPNSKGIWQFPFDQPALIHTIEGSQDFSGRRLLEEYAQHAKPVLVLRGADSQVWHRADFEAERAYFASFPQIRFLEVDGTGHGLPFEKRRLLADLVREQLGLIT